MTLRRLLIIRHAEEHETAGLLETGQADQHSLTVRGWQRAGALVGLFDADGALRPDMIHASAIAPDSESRRPQQTVAPLLAAMRKSGDVGYSDVHAKHDTEALMADVLTRDGVVLIAWEHSRIPDCVACLPDAPATPEKWPSERYDLIWSFERTGSGWDFTEIHQSLLPGDP